MVHPNYQSLFFTTATILEWKHLLKHDDLKEIVVDSLRFLRVQEMAYIHGFVIMPNHVHLIWTISGKHTLSSVKQSFLSFTAHAFKNRIKARYPHLLENFRVELSDRTYQFWKRNALSIPIYTDKVFYQKLEYIHENPLAEKWKLAERRIDYKYSSAYLGYPSPFWDFVSP